MTGSSWENATFFDFDNELIEEGGVGWMTHGYDFTLSTDYVPARAERLDLSYVDEEIKIRNTRNYHLSFPCNILLYSADGKVILSRKIVSADEQIISITVPGLLPGCYVVSLQDKVSAPFSEMICICK